MTLSTHPLFTGGPPVCLPATATDPGQRWIFGFPDGLTAEVHTLGARLHGLWVPDRHGTPADVVLAPRDPARTADTARYFGSTVGRYANRIARGRFSLDGTPYQLATQESGHCLHGGTDGFDTRIWEAESVHTAERTGVLLHLRSPDGDQGFPGNLDVTVSCLVSRDNELTFSYAAVTDAPPWSTSPTTPTSTSKARVPATSSAMNWPSTPTTTRRSTRTSSPAATTSPCPAPHSTSAGRSGSARPWHGPARPAGTTTTSSWGRTTNRHRAGPPSSTPPPPAAAWRC